MKKLLIAAIAASLFLGGSAAMAQSTTTRSSTTSGAVASAGSVGAVFMPGAISTGAAAGAAGAAAASSSSGLGFNQPQMIMSTAGAPSTSTFNECGIAFSGGLWVLTFSYTGESKSCVAQRQALLAMQMGQGPMAFELMCDVDTWRSAAERTNGVQCAQSIENRRIAEEKANRNRPVAVVAPVVQPVRVAAVSRADCLRAANANIDQAAYTAAVAQCPVN